MILHIHDIQNLFNNGGPKGGPSAAVGRALNRSPRIDTPKSNYL